MDKSTYSIRIERNGRILIPAEVRHAMNLRSGEEIQLSIEEGEMRLYTKRQALEKAQAFFRQYIPADISLVDELLAERRLEAAREHGE